MTPGDPTRGRWPCPRQRLFTDRFVDETVADQQRRADCEFEQNHRRREQSLGVDGDKPRRGCTERDGGAQQHDGQTGPRQLSSCDDNADDRPSRGQPPKDRDGLEDATVERRVLLDHETKGTGAAGRGALLARLAGRESVV